MQITNDLFKYPFQDERWKNKMLVGGLLVLGTYIFFPIGFFLYGYTLRIVRHTAAGEPPALPEWDNWGDLFVDGLKQWVVNIVYMLPLIVPSMCAYVSFGAGFLPLIFMDADVGAGMLVMLSAFTMGSLLFGLAFLIMFPAIFVSQVAVSRLAVTGSVGDAMQFGETWALARSGFKYFALAFIVYFGVAFAVGMVSQILFYTIVLACLYPFLMAAGAIYIMAIQGAMLGQAYYHSTQDNLAESTGEAR